ncbi:hypothetical protein CEXT_476381 [Caerostris extrusa]|uniref:Uncharacterized protein n=1 Tax=Caerostris extrusa TaxID=172846 RepID=A0AAV4WXP5_CAEEX|nr:hypothetical protein CEXT_476381 [Caerostris extrusa]
MKKSNISALRAGKTVSDEVEYILTAKYPFLSFPNSTALLLKALFNKSTYYRQQSEAVMPTKCNDVNLSRTSIDKSGCSGISFSLWAIFKQCVSTDSENEMFDDLFNFTLRQPHRLCSERVVTTRYPIWPNTGTSKVRHGPACCALPASEFSHCRFLLSGSQKKNEQ